MKGDPKIIEKLNEILRDELTAINQYMVHAEMCDNWGYLKLHKIIEKRSIDEMKHAEALIARILFLDGEPVVSKLDEIVIGDKVDTQFKNDWEAEKRAIGLYNGGIKLAVDLGDNGTRDLLEDNLTVEESHIDWIEAQFDQIKQMGVQDYLVEQVDTDSGE